MKVTVAFGDVKVVVPCGNGDITIRQLSELAITRYQKSLQQVEIDSDSPKMSVSINALVLARDCGILDWDDSVSDVIDDRELIIARFQNKPNSSNNKTTSNNNTITISNNNNQKHFGANINAVNTKTSNSNHHLCSEWKYCRPTTISSVSSCVVSQTDEKDFHNSTLTGKVISDADSIENQTLMHVGKNGSCLVSLSPDSFDSSNVATDHCCGIINSENKCAQNACFWKASLPNKGSFSLEESDSSQWPVPPPLIVTTSDESTLMNRSIFSNAIQTKCLTSVNPSDPLSQSKPLAYNITKKNPLANMAIPVYKMNHDTFPATTSLSSSLPSNADAKSLPQSFYSSLESTAVSDNNNSSYDETNGEIAESSKSTSINQLDEKLDEHFLGIKSKVNSVEVSENSIITNEIGLNTKCFKTEIDIPNESIDCNSSNVPEETNQNRSQKSTSVFYQSGFSSMGSNYYKTSSCLPVSPQMPPPMPPLRSAFTKLSPNPIKASIQPVNFLQVNTSDLDLPNESMTCMQIISKVPVSQTKDNELSKSEHSIPSLFESEDRVLEDPDNEWSCSGKSVDQESMATTTTTDTSVNTTTTTTNSHSTLNRTSEKHIITVTLKKSSNGFGFSLTSRQNPVDLTNPVYVSKVLENGPAIFDGRMRPGDRIVMINDEDVSQLSQTNIKDILLNIAAESLVKIGLFRPNSDTISNLIDSINTASTSQKKSSIPQVLNHAGETEDCNQICVEEQKPVSFPMCSCIHKSSQPCSKLNLFHFIIPLRTLKSDFLTPQIFETLTSDSISKSVVRSQNSESKTEPPAIPLNHQNKLSPCSFSNKSQSSTKASNATLGISVRRGVSQMSYSESHIDCQTTCQGQSKIYPFSKTPNQDISESFANNNYVGNTDESVHKFCPNCHGLLSLKSGVFVRSIIPGGAAHMDGRIQTGDEIIAVQGVCLYNGEDFVPPNNKVLLGDVYDSLKFAQVPLKFQNRIQFSNAISSNSDSNDKTDPLNLLKQILSHAQSICSSVSLTILRRSLEQRSCSINTLASVDTNCCHNVTVAADVHMPHKKEDKTDCLLSSFIMPVNLPSTGIHGNSVIHKQKIERFEEYHGIDHNQRYYRDEFDNNSDHHTSDLICLKSDHESDDPIPAVSSENNSLPSPSHTNNVSLADSYHVSSGILTDFEKVRVPQVITDIYNDSSVPEPSVDNVVTLRHSSINRQPSLSLSSDSVPNVIKYLGAELDFTYFNRHDSSRQSISTKRNIYKSPIFSNKPAKKFSDNLSTNFIKGDVKYNTMPRPVSSFTLYQVPEEELSDNLSPEPLSKHSYEDNVQTIDRRSTLRRRSGIGKYEERKRYRS